MKILICLKSKSKFLAVENTITIDKSIPHLLCMRKIQIFIFLKLACGYSLPSAFAYFKLYSTKHTLP